MWFPIIAGRICWSCLAYNIAIGFGVGASLHLAKKLCDKKLSGEPEWFRAGAEEVVKRALGSVTKSLPLIK